MNTTEMKENMMNMVMEQNENIASVGVKASEILGLMKIAGVLAASLVGVTLCGCSQMEPVADKEVVVRKVECKAPERHIVEAPVMSGRIMTAKVAPDPANEESVVAYCGNMTVRAVPDESVSMPWKVINRNNCFIVMSKKDYYLYVYERQGNNNVMIARYDCAFALNTGNKEKEGDMKTPACADMNHPFSISQICDARNWKHDFKDGRGNIKAYGYWFLRLDIGTSNRSIGIHGSTNNEITVPGRASEGCIRLKDSDIKDLRENYARVGMKVYIKAETIGDEDFEEDALTAFNNENPDKARKRNINPADKLSDAARLRVNS